MVSVIIPVYQVSEYVERCIRSVMAQSYANMECVIVDDATQDDSIVKCEALIRDYDGPIRFRILHHERNRGLSAARNTGMKAATGDYVYYLDSDDYIPADCIERLVSVLKDHPGMEMVQGNCVMTGNGPDRRLYIPDHPIVTTDSDGTRREFYESRHIYISVWNKLLSRSFLEAHDIYCREGIEFEDLPWVFLLMKHLQRAYLYNGITHYYCTRPGSISTAEKPKSVGCYVTIFDDIFRHLTAGREQEELKGLLYYFIKRYVSYFRMVPTFKETIKLYKTKCREQHCWYAYAVLTATAVIGRLGNPLRVLEWLNGLRWKMKKALLPH